MECQTADYSLPNSDITLLISFPSKEIYERVCKGTGQRL
jgi:hypothetical protein